MPSTLPFMYRKAFLVRLISIGLHRRCLSDSNSSCDSFTFNSTYLISFHFSTDSTMNSLLPLLPALVSDSESIIRQHLATQLLPLCLTCMFGDDPNFDTKNKIHAKPRVYNQGGYAIATVKLVSHMTTLIKDSDMDVRKAASDALATLALYIRSEDIPGIILRIPLQLVHDEKNRKIPKPNNQNNPIDSISDDLCISASHLLADVASISSEQVPPKMVSQHISPTVIALCKHPNFRVRRAAVQALPRVISGSSIDDVHYNLITSFVKLSQDEVYRVRKGVGECLVDMSRSLMLLANDRYVGDGFTNRSSGPGDYARMTKDELKSVMRDLRRKSLVPICIRLLHDSNKVVRHGMMQFLGPFIASFYPLDGGGHRKEDDGIVGALTRKNEKAAGGMGVQFFPHANGMVTRLNPENICSPITMPGITQPPLEEEPPLDSKEYLVSLLPQFLEKCDNDSKSLVNILRHRSKYPADKEDIAIVDRSLLPPYVDLANMNTGDDNVDAEMRVYCAYSLPAVVLLLGKNGWDKALKQCFLKLITGSTASPTEQQNGAFFVPLPVKRCLASSFHTICSMLGPSAMKASAEEEGKKQDLLTIFEVHFLRDADDTVRLNVIRNLPSFLSLLSFSKRSKYLPVLCEIIRGDTMLASKRKNALNPMLLNWRQRDMIAQILPNLICLYRPDQVRQYLWPIVKTLLNDSVNLVRQNVEWSIPILLKCYEFNNCLAGRDDATMASTFSQESCNEVYVFLKATLLDNKPTSSKATTCGAFSKRQSYCRILSAAALVLRLHEMTDSSKAPNGDSDSVDEAFPYAVNPFYSLTPESYTHLYHLLRTLFLPPALAMKDDTVTNVRLTLAKCLRVMPHDIRDRGDAKTILRILEDEIETWEGGGGQHMDVQLTKIKPAHVSPIKANTNPSKKISVKGMQMDGPGDKKGGQYDDDSMSLASI